MSVTHQDFNTLLQLDQVYRPSIAAKKFAYSNELAEVVEAGAFFESYSLDSDERFYINEIANYFEMLGLIWQRGVVDNQLVIEWSGTHYFWQKVGPILIQSRKVFDSPDLWEYFENLANAHTDFLNNK